MYTWQCLVMGSATWIGGLSQHMSKIWIWFVYFIEMVFSGGESLADRVTGAILAMSG